MTTVDNVDRPSHTVRVTFFDRGCAHAFIDVDFAPTKREAIDHALEEYDDRGDVIGVQWKTCKGNPDTSDYRKTLKERAADSITVPHDWTLDVDPMTGNWMFIHPHLDLTFWCTPFIDDGESMTLDVQDQHGELLRHERIPLDMDGHYYDDLDRIQTAINDTLPRIT